MTADHTADRYGFTHQEMLDNVELIHMNGRVYDPNLGRFLSVDPVFEFPTNTQSLNPYSYVLNNPLSLTDPTGYAAATCPTGTSCPADNQPPNTTVTEHVSYTPTGSHIAVSGTLTAKSGGNGGIAVTASNKALAQTFSAGAKAMFGNGVQTSQGATDAQNKPTDAQSIGSLAAISRGNNAILNNTQIGNIIFNETRSEHGALIDVAREVATDVVINGDEELGVSRPQTAKDTLNEKGLSKKENNTLGNIRKLVTTVRTQRAQGVDLANGAIHFNLRDPARLEQYSKTLNSWKFGLPPMTKLGPFTNSFPTKDLGPTNNWFETYENPE
ncbi:MAG: RHS repeat-associated core domain-containing protein [Gammaproteobacteria bacterium]